MGELKLINIDMMSNIFKMDVDHLYNYLQAILEKEYTTVHTGGVSSSRYIYAEGELPYMLVAHLDTVHRETCQQIKFDFFKTKEGAMYTALSSPQGIGGDDRCGVILILSLLLNCGLKPSILFTCGEETGGHGAREFCKNFTNLSLNFIIEFDRRGKKDVVCYGDSNTKLTESLERYGFKRSSGSFSDISIIAPHLKVSAVNLSSGYYNAHTTRELVVLEELTWILNHSYKFLTSKYTNEKYTYKERVYTYTPQKYKYFGLPRAKESFKEEYDYQSQRYYQNNIFDYITPPPGYRACDLCGEQYSLREIIETTDGSLLCPSCADMFVSAGDYTVCPSCGCLTVDKECCDLCGWDLKGGEW